MRVRGSLRGSVRVDVNACVRARARVCVFSLMIGIVFAFICVNIC